MSADPEGTDVYQVRASWTRWSVLAVTIGALCGAAIATGVVVNFSKISSPAARVGIALPALAVVFGLGREILTRQRKRRLLEITATGVRVWPFYFGQGRSLAWAEIDQVSVAPEVALASFGRSHRSLRFTPSEAAYRDGKKQLSIPLDGGFPMPLDEIAEQIARHSQVPVSMEPGGAAPTGR